MSEKKFSFEIITPHRMVYQGEVVSLTAPGSLGSLGILANHAPIITSLVPGRMTYRDAAGRVTILHSTGRGFLEVNHNKAVLLADEVTE